MMFSRFLIQLVTVMNEIVFDFKWREVMIMTCGMFQDYTLRTCS